ncbi:MAG TPA: nuclear transport factor 2 family protein [Terriglobia bacterium]|nr:nuclear transport factor 2 family protein [Terriglobia bacterium]
MALMLIWVAAMLQGTPAAPRPAHPAARQAQAATEPKHAAVRPEAEIRALLRQQVADWNRGDVTAFMQGYWNSPNTEFVSSNGISRGWQTVLDRYRKAYPDRAAMGHLTFSGLEITLLGPKAALAVGHWQLQRNSGAPGGVFTLVFRKFPEGWRIINDHTSQSP